MKQQKSFSRKSTVKPYTSIVDIKIIFRYFVFVNFQGVNNVFLFLTWNYLCCLFNCIMPISLYTTIKQAKATFLTSKVTRIRRLVFQLRVMSFVKKPG